MSKAVTTPNTIDRRGALAAAEIWPEFSRWVDVVLAKEAVLRSGWENNDDDEKIDAEMDRLSDEECDLRAAMLKRPITAGIHVAMLVSIALADTDGDRPSSSPCHTFEIGNDARLKAGHTDWQNESSALLLRHMARQVMQSGILPQVPFCEAEFGVGAY